MKRIIGVGNALVDIVVRMENDKLLEDLGLPRGSMQLVDKSGSSRINEEIKRLSPSYSAGGSAANTIHGLAKLGIGTGFIGKIGNDETGSYFDKDMKSAGSVTILRRSETVTGRSIVLVSPDSERTFATHLGAAIELTEEEIDEDILEGYGILYLEGYLVSNRSLVIRLCELARKNGMEIALDMASYNVVEENIDFFKEIINKYVDIVFANEDEARGLTGMDAENAAADIALKCGIAVVKRGKRGSVVRQGDETWKFGALDVECRDTTGAGDLFASGFLFGYANSADLEKCGLLATLLAGNIIQVMGAKMEKDRWDNILYSVNEIMGMDQSRSLR